MTESEIAWRFIAAGILVWLWRAPPKWLDRGKLGAYAAVPIAAAGFAAAGGPARRLQLGRCSRRSRRFFPRPALSSSARAWQSCRFSAVGVVTEYQWLIDKQFVDAVAVAMITPGPVVITVGFIGDLVAGLPGACVAALATFLPRYLRTIFPAPYFKKYGKLPGLVAIVDGVRAAAIGAITSAVIVLAKRSLVDVPTVLLAIITAALLWRFKKLQEPVIITAVAITGLVFYPLLRQ